MPCSKLYNQKEFNSIPFSYEVGDAGVWSCECQARDGYGETPPARERDLAVAQQEKSERYRGTTLMRKRRLLGPYSRTKPEALWWSWGGGCFL